MYSQMKKFQIAPILSASLVSLLLISSTSAVKAGDTLNSIKKISANSDQELTIEFTGSDFPCSPQILDLPGPNHRIVIDFSGAACDRGSLHTSEEISKILAKTLPFVKGVRYSDLENAPKPTARIVLDLPESLKTKPRIVKIENGTAIIALSDKPIEIAEKTETDTPAITEPETNNSTSNEVADTKISSSTENNSSETANTETTNKADNQTPSTLSSGELQGNPKLTPVKLYNKAVQLHLSGKLSEAIIAYKEALESNSNLAEAHSNLGLIFNQQHNYAQALSEFRKALAINAKDAITYNGIGAALRAEHDLQGAIKNWQTAVSLDPKLATAHYNLGTAYEIEKEYDKALSAYRSAVQNDYRLGEAYYRMGLIMERKHRAEEAAAQFKESLRISADSEYSEDARQRLAFIQGKKGKTQ